MFKFKKCFYYILFTLIFTIILTCTFSHSTFAAEPKLVSTLNKAFEKIESWLLKLSTPAAAVAVASGVFMKKFSFGDEERIRIGKKLIKGSLFSYGFILATDLVLSAIQSLIG